jgi:hypothetical protein
MKKRSSRIIDTRPRLIFRFLCGALFLAEVTRLKMIQSLSSSIFFNPWPVFCCLQNRLNELGENFAIEIREW